jgi:DNA (cytosine-5)-methyltransferase 1
MIAIENSLMSQHPEFNPYEKLEAIRHDFLKRKGLPVDKPISVKEALSDLETQNKQLIGCVDSPRFKQIVYSAPETDYQRLLHGSMNGKAPNSLRLANHGEEIRNRFAAMLNTCRRGVQLSKEDRERFGLKKHCTVPLDPTKPSHTLTTLPDDIVHYSEPRILNVREYARLQSFPDWYEFKGKYTTGGDRRVQECPRYTQVGNAVPPFLAECLGLLLADLVKQLRPSGEANSL